MSFSKHLLWKQKNNDVIFFSIRLDDQIWGSDEEKDDEEDEDENEMNDEEEGKGSKEEDEKHNELDGNNEPKQGENDEGLDAANRKFSKPPPFIERNW